MKKKDYTITEVAKMLGVHRQTVYNMINDGVLKAYKLPILKGGWRVKPEEIERLKSNVQK